MLKMINFILWADLVILGIGWILLFITSIKFFKGNDLRDKIVGFGLLSIAIAFILGSIFNFYSLYEGIYWVIVEIFHLFGVILITFGILGFNGKGNHNGNKKENKKRKNNLE